MIFFWYEESSSAFRYGIVRWCLHGTAVGLVTLIAARTACVLLTMPTTTEPCLTASCAYSTWKMRPCGEKVTESLS